MSAHDVFAEALQRISGDDQAEDRGYDDWRQRELDDQREQTLNAALDACKAAGVPMEHLKTLAFETGATFWAAQQSLKD